MSAVRTFVLVCLLSAGMIAAGVAAQLNTLGRDSSGWIAGKVTDARSGEPLVGAAVILQGTEKCAATDVGGTYWIGSVRAGAYTLTASMTGYTDSRNDNLHVVAGCTTRLDLRLASLVLSRSRLESLLARPSPSSSAPSNSAKGGVKRATDRPKRSRLPLPALRDANKHSDRFPIQAYGIDGLNSKWGYMDKTGKVVIKPQFDTAESFSCGLALVKADSGYRYIDAAGNFAFGGWFKEATGYSEGAASVVIRDSKGANGWGVIGKTGETLFQSHSGAPVVFSEGLAWFGVKDWGYGAIDPSGDTVIRPMFGFSARPFSDGLAQASFGHHIGFLDKAGHVAIKQQFDQAADFHEGMAYFMNKRDNAPDRRGYINKTGKVVIKPQFEDARDFSEGLAPVEIDGKWGYINRAGRVVIPPQFTEARSFSEGLAVVRGIDSSPLYGYIDKRGEVVINPQFSRADDFSDGLAQVRVGDKPRRSYRLDVAEMWRPIERSDKPQPDYGDVYRTGYIDRTGKYVW